MAGFPAEPVAGFPVAAAVIVFRAGVPGVTDFPAPAPPATDLVAAGLIGSRATPLRVDFFAESARAVTTLFADVAVAADVDFARVGSTRPRVVSLRPRVGSARPSAG
ncbi:hypothetical protein ADL15_24920 [Actinoplanes awajinensis subsp. mycoplanecinus]|uniref:Uncharacterized protein n=1 Tax=Actinoplanes awajinensis subsp. mycoplanecinus TaxID=135947 RepID=A0A117MQH3_9ACTN|nr:hypothetical protein ADL15_24920 [Actinoplanes awajinensis subsp. mycoplanecinus]